MQAAALQLFRSIGKFVATPRMRAWRSVTATAICALVARDASCMIALISSGSILGAVSAGCAVSVGLPPPPPHATAAVTSIARATPRSPAPIDEAWSENDRRMDSVLSSNTLNRESSA